MVQTRAKQKRPKRLFAWLALALVVSVVVGFGYKWVAPPARGPGGIKPVQRIKALLGRLRPGPPPQRNDLSAMRTVEVRIKGRKLRLWLAETPRQQRLGLMWVEPDQMADDQGMLFVFRTDQIGPFWMKNTLIPLEIAFIRRDGTVLAVQRMKPKSLVNHKPPEPYRYALEVKAGVLSAIGLQKGDVVVFPPTVLNP